MDESTEETTVKSEDDTNLTEETSNPEASTDKPEESTNEIDEETAEPKSTIELTNETEQETDETKSTNESEELTNDTEQETAEPNKSSSKTDQEIAGPNETSKEVTAEPDQLSVKDSKFNLKTVFARPKFTEPRHPILSSPFARHISLKAFGPRKPKWYTPLSTAQFYLFQDLLKMVELGREGTFHFDNFMEMLKDFDPTVTNDEVLELLEKMEKNEFEELDYGKFLFRIAHKDHIDNAESETSLKRVRLTPRQGLLLSAISYFVLITSPEDIQRYYLSFTRQKQTVLWFHMEAERLQGLTERQMEVKQKQARKNLRPLFLATGSPYALPVPFVPCFKKSKTFRDFMKKRPTLLHTALPLLKKEIQRPIKPYPTHRNIGDKVVFKDEDEELMAGLTYGHFKMPDMTIPAAKLREMRNKCTMRHVQYIKDRAEKAMKLYNDRVKKALMLTAKHHLRRELAKGFHSKNDVEQFIQVHDRYMPREKVENFSLWVPPCSLGSTDWKTPDFSHKIAFGRKVT